jgi:hypothetical protein
VQSVFDVRDVEAEIQFVAKPQEQVKQRHGVRPARDGDHDGLPTLEHRVAAQRGPHAGQDPKHTGI